MSKPTTLTPDQQLAVDTRNSNILVNAAAGSGKTAVLVKRIIKMISDPKTDINADNLLVVTFTNAAAGEMRERISRALSDELKHDPKNPHLKKQLFLLNFADITTIDSFCQNIVRNNFHLLGLDPNFSPADETDLSLIVSDAIDKCFEILYTEKNADFLNLVKIYSKNRSDTNLKNTVLDIHKYISTLPHPKKWCREACDMYLLSEGFDGSIYKKTIFDKIGIILDECINTYNSIYTFLPELQNSAALISDETDLKTVSGYITKLVSVINDDTIVFETLKTALNGSWNNVYDVLKKIKFKSSPSRTEKINTALNSNFSDNTLRCLDNIIEFRNTAITPIKKDIKAMVYESSENLEVLLREKLYPTIKAMTELVEKFDEIYMDMKNAKNIYSFSDIEHFCLNLLLDENDEPTELALSLREKYSEILLDEYQDSNQLQEAIFTAVSNGKNMFMVGDVKQSIYRFRNSDPTLFKLKSDSFSTVRGSNDFKILLSKNFRSRENIIDTTNEIFENIMSDYIGEITYNDEHKLVYGGLYPNGGSPKSEFYIISPKNESDNDTPDDNISDFDNDENDEIPLKNIELEAKFIARRIKKLKDDNFKVYERDGSCRKIENKDIAILLRSAKSSGAVIAEELKKNGIDAFFETDGYFEKTEVMLILSLLKIILNPTQDIPFIAVLRSIIGNFSDNELAIIRTYGDGCMYDALTAASENVEDTVLADKCKYFSDKLHRWRNYAKYMSSDKLIWTLYTETDYYSYIGSLAGGEESRANLRLLFERAKKYESSGFKGLFNFITLIERMIENKTSLNPASLITENHNVVRIMTIHKSKGLEFPVVFLACSQRKFYRTKPSGDITMHKNIGFGMDYINPQLKYRYPSVTNSAVSIISEIENISEEMRMLYVAVTRAKEKLIITGTTSADIDTDIPLPMSKMNVLKGYSYMKWLAPIAFHSDNWLAEIVYADIIKKEHNEDTTQKQKIIKSDIDINEIFNYIYPFKNSAKLPSKISVSELKRRAYPDENDFTAKTVFSVTSEITPPSFLTKATGKLTSAQRGTILHTILENIKFQENMTYEYIQSETERIVSCDILTHDEATAVNLNKIVKFFNSDICRRMLASKNIFREVPFEIQIPAKDYDISFADEYGDEKIILQGIIDCYFIENDKIILIDYKTDYYTDVSEMVNKYKAQLDCYATALEQTYAMPVHKKYLYLFHTDCTVEI